MEKLGDLFFERDGKIWHAAKFKKIYLSRKMAKLGDLKPSCDKNKEISTNCHGSKS